MADVADSGNGTAAHVVPLSLGGQGPPVYLVPGPAGQLSHYSDLIEKLGVNHPIYGLRPAGLYNNSAPRSRMSDIASDYADELGLMDRESPYALVGHCWSGLIAYETARQLAELDKAPSLLVVLDSYYMKSVPRRELERRKLVRSRRPRHESPH